MVLDLGRWWEGQTGLPLPLGAIVIRRDLGPEVAGMVEEKIRESLIRSKPPRSSPALTSGGTLRKWRPR